MLWYLPKAISLQSFNAVDCLGQVLQRDYKKIDDDFIMTSFIFLEFEISKVCETNYKLLTFQVSSPSVI